MSHIKLDKSVGLFLCVVAVLSVASLSATGSVIARQGDLLQNSVVPEGESLEYYAPHHSGASHATHYFSTTGDDHHFAWGGVTPATSGPVVVKYDFRAQGAFANVITAAQRGNAISALGAWSAATGGKLSFVLDTVSAASGIINIGTGDLAALGGSSGMGGTLGLGGGTFTHDSAHTITVGAAWQDSSDIWDTTIGNDNPIGTFDYFTVVAQEIGHALGLGHTTGADIMNGGYTGELTALSAVDVGHITSVYGLTAVPEPATLVLLGLGSALIAGRQRRRIA